MRRWHRMGVICVCRAHGCLVQVKDDRIRILRSCCPSTTRGISRRSSPKSESTIHPSASPTSVVAESSGPFHNVTVQQYLLWAFSWLSHAMCQSESFSPFLSPPLRHCDWVQSEAELKDNAIDSYTDPGKNRRVGPIPKVAVSPR